MDIEIFSWKNVRCYCLMVRTGEILFQDMHTSTCSINIPVFDLGFILDLFVQL